VDRVFADPEHAATLLIFEEVGLDARSIGSPVAAAGSSFVAFTIGALVPLVPYVLLAGGTAFGTSLGLSLAALALLGYGISRLTHRPPLYASARQVLLGGAAAAVTFAVGSLIGVQAGGWPSGQRTRLSRAALAPVGQGHGMPGRIAARSLPLTRPTVRSLIMP
jgi:hypothetical protein